MILVDSSVWIDYFQGKSKRETRVLDNLLGNEPIAIGDLILTEVLQGFRADKDFRTARRLLSGFPVYELLGEKMALKSAENFRKLRKQGITIRKTADVIIASYCIEQRIPLLFSDKDFEPFVDHLGLLKA
jgi:predicted nucleic acid-binding protein